MLFDKCLLTVRRAEAAFAAGDVEAPRGARVRAADMVTELRASLDLEAAAAAPASSTRSTCSCSASCSRQPPPRPGAPRAGARVLGELRDAFAGAQAQLARSRRPPRSRRRSA
jgi:hypothetical protein